MAKGKYKGMISVDERALRRKMQWKVDKVDFLAKCIPRLVSNISFSQKGGIAKLFHVQTFQIPLDTLSSGQMLYMKWNFKIYLVDHSMALIHSRRSSDSILGVFKNVLS